MILRKEADMLLHIYFSNGKDSLYKVTQGNAIHSLPFSYTLAVTNDNIFGLKNTSPKLIATKVDKLKNKLTEVPAIDSKGNFDYSFPVAYDTVNNLYLIARNTSSVGRLIFFDAAKGIATDSISTGLFTTAFTPDYREGVVLGFNNHNESNAVASIFPNPCKDVLNIKNNTNASDWKILNLQGQVIESGLMNGLDEKISTETLAKGVYFLQLSGNATTSSTKFVKE